jgi:type II secretory pathway component PulJ
MIATLISTMFMALLLLAGWSIVHDLTRPLDLTHRDVMRHDNLVIAVEHSPQPVRHLAPARPARAIATRRFAPHALAA